MFSLVMLGGRNLVAKRATMWSFSSWNIWVFPKIGVPQNGWLIMENPLFSETSIWFVVCLVGRATLWWCKWSRLVGELNTLAWNQVLLEMRKPPKKMKGKQPPRVVWLMVFAFVNSISFVYLMIVCFFVQLQNLTGSWQYALKSLHELHGFHILLKQCHVITYWYQVQLDVHNLFDTNSK